MSDDLDPETQHAVGRTRKVRRPGRRRPGGPPPRAPEMVARRLDPPHPTGEGPQGERGPHKPNALVWVDAPPLAPVALGPRRPQLRVGRTHADITLPHKEVSRRHAVIRVEGRTVLVEDLGSSNGTYLNHVLLRAPAEVRPGDKLGIGPYELRILDAPPAAAASDMDATAIISTLSGDLSEVGGVELFQDIEFNQRSGTLEVRSRRSLGILELREGHPISARFDDLGGREAMLAVLALRQGHFTFHSGEPKGDPLPFRLSALLLDYARAQDEQGR